MLRPRENTPDARVTPLVRGLAFALAALAASSCAPRAASPASPAMSPTQSPTMPATAAGDATQGASGGVAFAFAAAPMDTPDDPTRTPAFQYARLDRAACEAELAKRQLPFARVPEARGVLAPVRLTGPIRGVAIHSVLPPKKRDASPLEILDCRLVLALDDFAQILAKYDVVEIVHMSVYRPPSAKRWPEGKLGTRHDGALAIDAGKFVRKDGTVLDVEKDFHGRIGTKTCGPNTGPAPATAEAIALRGIVCEAADAHLFNVELTPDYNWQHRNHFHLEVTPRVKWFLVH